MDTDHSGSIDFEEFCAGMRTMIERKAAHPDEYVGRTATTGVGGHSTSRADRELENGLAQSDAVGVNQGDGAGAAADDDDDESDDGEEDVPAEFKDMSPQQQQRAILKRSLWMMLLGTVVVLVVSDPMVDVLSEIGHRTSIPPFYVSFVLAPLASNASELIASYSYALKKTKQTATIAISALEGAAALNNTFCLGIFLALVYARGLVWEYSAETASILLVELAMFVIAVRKSQSLASACVALSLFPLSIVVVIVLEKAGWD
jgi:Ca2+/Na+ antiporter